MIYLKKINKEQLVMGIIIGLVCIVLICVMFVQFKTVEETDITEDAEESAEQE